MVDVNVHGIVECVIEGMLITVVVLELGFVVRRWATRPERD
jgi:hypothetical protein